MSATFRLNGVSLCALKMKLPTHCLGPFVVNPFNTNCNTKTLSIQYENDSIHGNTSSNDININKVLMTKTSQSKLNNNIEGIII